MRISPLIFTALLAVASGEALAAPNAAPDADAINHFCYRPGEPCTKLKRAADAVADALAAPAPAADARVHHFCYRPGEACSKAKRDALALAEAVADAHAMALPAPDASKLP